MEEKRATKSILHRESCLALQHTRKDIIMLWTIAVILVILWLLGLITSYTMGGFIHILLVLAIIVILYNVISGRKGSA
jgi:fatty acid desaturase